MYQSENHYVSCSIQSITESTIIYLSGSKTGRVVVQLESHRRVRSGDDLKQIANCHHVPGQEGYRPHLASHPVHRDDGSLVRIKIYEAIACRLPGELVGHHLDAHHASLPHHGDRILEVRIIIIE